MRNYKHALSMPWELINIEKYPGIYDSYVFLKAEKKSSMLDPMNNYKIKTVVKPWEHKVKDKI